MKITLTRIFVYGETRTNPPTLPSLINDGHFKSNPTLRLAKDERTLLHSKQALCLLIDHISRCGHGPIEGRLWRRCRQQVQLDLQCLRKDCQCRAHIQDTPELKHVLPSSGITTEHMGIYFPGPRCLPEKIDNPAGSIKKRVKNG
jgi:hypothetical protein